MTSPASPAWTLRCSRGHLVATAGRLRWSHTGRPLRWPLRAGCGGRTRAARCGGLWRRLRRCCGSWWGSGSRRRTVTW